MKKVARSAAVRSAVRDGTCPRRYKMRTSSKGPHAILGIVILTWAIMLAYVAVVWGQNNIIPTKSTGIVKEGRHSVKNLCENARIDLLTEIPDTAGLSKLIDGSRADGVEASLLRDTPVRITFRGRPPWMNVVSIFYEGEIDFRVFVGDLYRNDTTVEFTSERIDHGDGVTELKLECADIRITTLVVVPMVEGNPDAIYGTVLEIEAYFRSIDPDNGIGGEWYSVGDEYVQYYVNKPCGFSPNLPMTQADAESFSQFMNYWDYEWKFNWGNDLAWESDFTSDEGCVHKVDFAYFSGHGGPGKFAFAGKRNKCEAKWRKCKGEWGVENLDWLALSACQTLKGKKEILNWHKCFNGLHLLCGWATNMKDVNLGEPFATALTRHGCTIPQAWLCSARLTHGAGSGNVKRSTVIVAEEEDNLNDHIWYSGYVSPKPDHDRYAWYLICEFYGTKGPTTEMQFNRSSARLIAPPGRKGPAILVSRDLLDRNQGRSMPELLHIPRVVDSFYVRGLADGICECLGMLCSVEIFYDAMTGEYSLYDGPYELRVFENTGGWEFMHSDRYLVPAADRPELPLPQDALDSANSLLQCLGWLPVDAVQDEPRYIHIGMLDSLTEEEDPDSSYDLSITANYYREYSGYSIAGPGASIQVGLGDAGELHTAFCGGWRDLVPGPDVTIISLADALEDVACSGGDIAVGSMPPCDTFLVEAARPGYFEPDCRTPEGDPEMVWLADGYALAYDAEEGITDTSFYDLVIRSRNRHPCGHIDSPSEDTTIVYGTALALEGSATSGTPPYSFAWYSDIDGYLGSGSSLTVPDLSISAVSHSIVLEVVDANQMTDVASVGVTVVHVDTVPSINPDPMSVYFAYAPEAIPGTAYLRSSILPPEQTLSDIDLYTLLINRAVEPTGAEVIGDELKIYFDARDFVPSYGLVWDTVAEVYTVSGLFLDGSAFSLGFLVDVTGYRPGDANLDGTADLADAVFIINYIFKFGQAPLVPETADANCDGNINVGDAVYLINYVIKGGPAPCHE